MKRLFLFFLLLCLGFAGCATSDHPVLEYVLAREAFSAAKDVDAARFAPGYFHKAEENYRRAERLFKEKSYSQASDAFKVARHFSEKAENASRVIRQKNGDEGL